MRDERIDRLARVLVRYSTALKKGENVMIEAFDVPPAMVSALVREARAVDANPVVLVKHNEYLREMYRLGSEESLSLNGSLEKDWMSKMDAYIGIRGAENVSELADVPLDRMSLYQKCWWKPVHLAERINNTRWVVLRYPTASMAQLAGTSTAAFEDFYFNVCASLDYAKMSRAMDPLVKRMEATDKVRLVAEGTDLTFSIKGISAIKCDGRVNIPDGEVYTAPVKTSVNGVITFNAATVFNGVTHERVRLEFKEGRIEKATSSDTDSLNHVLNTDEGSRFVGEFAIGFNPWITRPMKDTLFDEKIAGSIHFTPGNAYENADNGNRSQVHWDLVLMMMPENGGGEIWFDDVLVRKDGLFTEDELKPLNPQALLG